MTRAVSFRHHCFFYQVSNATGKLAVTPVCNFDQSDLCADDVMLLDTVSSVFVWVGPQANETERSEVGVLSTVSYLTVWDGCVRTVGTIVVWHLRHVAFCCKPFGRQG